MEQSAIDAGCSADDFMKSENIIVRSVKNDKARKYLDLPLPCNFIYYGNNVVASVSEEYRDIAKAYLDRNEEAFRIFETPSMHFLNEKVEPVGGKVCFMAEYFLPDVNRLKPLDCPYETRILTQKDFSELYTGEWHNALCADRKELDVLGVGAYDGEKLIGLAACSADCDSMWQIGIDVFPDYRRQGIASALTSRLAMEILDRGRVPFYCAAWSNIRSVRNAISSGFRPAWVELTVKNRDFVENMYK